VVDTIGLHAEFERAPVLHSDVIATARHHAAKVAATGSGNGWKSRFGTGGIGSHFQGKLAEAAVQIHAEDVGDVNPEATPIRFRYGARSLIYDFAFRDALDQKITVEVKSGTKTFQEVESWDLSRYGMPVNQKQIHSGKGLRDVFVYCVVDRTGLFDPVDPVVKVAVVGWCRWDAIVKQPVRSRGMDDPCVIVPIGELRPMSMFYSYLKTGRWPEVKTENVNEVELLRCQTT
jgi:hypothetical protein